MENYFFSFNKLAYVKGKRPDGCILCHVNSKNPVVDDLSVYQDELFNVSVNLYPYNPGHLLVFPLRHLKDIREYSEGEEKRFNLLCKYLLTVLDKTHAPFAYNLGYNMGLDSGASIEHLHYHIIPRYPREIGIADLIGGSRVLVEDPFISQQKIQDEITKNPLRL